MARNIKKIVEERRGNISPRYDLTSVEMEYLYRLTGDGNTVTADDLYEALEQSFVYGYEMGFRAAEKEMEKREGAGDDGKLDKH